MQFPKLFEPGRIGTLQLQNRLIMAAMGTFSATAEGEATQRMLDYYAARARGGVGLIIVQLTSVMANARGGRYHLAAYDDKFIPRLRKISQVAHEHGAKIALQFGHHGTEHSEPPRLKGFEPGEMDIVAPSAIPYTRTGVVPRELSIAEIHQIAEAFAEAARRARDADFDAVEFHGAHGKLISQFFCPYYNRRTDDYGGSLEKRARFACEILERSRSKVGSDFPLILRVDGYNGFEGGATIDDLVKQVPLLVEAGADALHISAGSTEASHWQFVTYLQPYGMLVPFAAAVKKVAKVPVIAVAKLGDPAVAEQVLRDGSADFVALARPFLADPELPNKVREGRDNEIVRCIFCNNCFANMWRRGLCCTVNPSLNREREFEITPARSPKNVLVVGGGLAGMEAARVAAERGHRVTLYERSDKLGGQWNIACQQEAKREFASVTLRLSRGLERAGVKVIMNTEVTPELVKESHPDVVVVATGAVPATLDVPGANGKNVVQAVDVITGQTTVGQEVVVIGGRYVGMELAVELAGQGKRVSLITRRQLGRDLERNTRLVLRDRLIEHGVFLYPYSLVLQITDKGVAAATDNERFFLKADTVVLAVGASPVNALARQLEGLVPEVHQIGDCVEARDALEAIYSGAEVGRQV
ncbi:MAG: NAD(P)/FAD-dependent oxidoreductase [Chloroflexota bacterium]